MTLNSNRPVNRFGAFVLLSLLALVTACASSPSSEEASVEEAGLLADVRTERALLRQFADTPQLAGETIIANVVDGVATLSGSVRSSVEREMAEQIARSAAGVTQVSNTLTTEN